MNIKERITKHTNLELNDSLSAFDNHFAQQHHEVYSVFYEFFKMVKPKRILEIGTALGGFTMFLKIISDELNLNTNILSFDVYKRDWYDDMIKNGIDVRVEDIFGNFNNIPDEIINFIQSDGITIVLCDGGSKINEFNLLSKYIKKNDFILAHDYCENMTYFETDIKNKIWNWCEITEDDIRNSSIDNNLDFFNKENFSKVVWVCKIKK